MAIAVTLHVVSAILTVAAPFALAPAGASPEATAAGQEVGFTLLYIGTFIFALGMFLLAITELGTDSWISDIMRSVLESPTRGTLFLVWTSFIMFVLRFFAGPMVARLTPLGLLALGAGVASVGLLWLSQAGTAALMLFLAATFYGFGKAFLWPTTLGVVTEQYPRGGALMLNAIAGVGMISVGTIGNPAIGAMQDAAFSAEIRVQDPALAERVVASRPGLFGESLALDPTARGELSAELAASEQRVRESVAGGAPADIDAALAADAQHQELATQVALIDGIDSRTKQGTLGQIAILPAIMVVCYLGLILYFHRKGGYRARSITEHAVAGAAAPPREGAAAR